MLRHYCGVSREVLIKKNGLNTFWRFSEAQTQTSIYLSTLFLMNSVRYSSTNDAVPSENNNNNTIIMRRQPQLRRLSVIRPDLVDEWVPELNDTDVSSVQLTSNINVWWRCSLCGANYQATVKDRAVNDKSCPHCMNTQNNNNNNNLNSTISSSSSPITSTIITNTSEETNEINKSENDNKSTDPSLAETHPLLAQRWDQERNGFLRPTDVNYKSELNVWWKPKEGRPAHETSFRCPIHAFIEMPFSMEEQQEAQVALELNILQQIRGAAKIKEAREHNNFPAAAYTIDDMVSKSHGIAAVLSPVENNNNNNNNITLEQEEELVGEDLHKALELWESNFNDKFNKENGPIFQFSGSNDGAGVSREQVLTTYDRFVTWHKNQKKMKSKGIKSNDNDSSDTNISEDTVIPSVITDSDWLQYFTLSVEDVAKDRFAPSAQLILSDNNMFTKYHNNNNNNNNNNNKENSESTTINKARRVDSLPAPPEEYINEVHTLFAQPQRGRIYPRQPPIPPSREDDLTEGIPKARDNDINNNNNTRRKISNEFESDNYTNTRSKSSLRHKEAPVEAAFELVSLSSAQSLIEEYAGIGESNNKSINNKKENNLFDADEKDLHLRTLLGPVAIQSMSEDQARNLQYNRGTPRPRRTGRFRLRPPVDSERSEQKVLISTLGTASSINATETLEEKQEQQIIQAPGAPRKVSRPKKKRQDNETENNNNNNNNNNSISNSDDSCNSEMKASV